MSAKHTPGPWHVFSVYAQHEVRTPTDALVAVANDRANARLIAAAPDLLEALRDLVDAMTGRLDGETIALHNALIVLAKAEGKA